MGLKKRSARELAEYISGRILNNIEQKIRLFEAASQNEDVEGMLTYQLTDEERQYVQAQQKLDQDADAIDSTSGFLDDMSDNDIDTMYEQLSKSFEDLDLPEAPDLGEDS